MSKIRWRTICIYGVSGAGKTTLATTAPKPMVLDTNQGLASVDGRPGWEFDDAPVKGIDTLNRAFDNFSGTGKKNWRKIYQSIVFDHFDEIQAMFLDFLGERRAEKDDRADPDELVQKDWGVMGSKLRRYIRKFKSLPCHKIMICGEKEDRETGRMQPSLLGALGRQLPYFCDEIMYLRIGKKGQRYLHLDPTDTFYAKTRAWWMPAEDRKIKVPENDPKFLTNLFELLAAGPKSAGTKRREKKDS